MNPVRRNHTSSDPEIWIGADPGGAGNFGVAILKADGSAHTCRVDHADEALRVVLEHVAMTPAGVGVDAPLWWSSGRSGLRCADVWIRKQHPFFAPDVLAVNSLRGAVLAQGLMFVQRLRERFPNVPVTETHPKAVLNALSRDEWDAFFEELETTATLDDEIDHERDAMISAIAARESFQGRWIRDLSQNRGASEQNPGQYWLAPVHYFWPG